jgi:hypothetical protein
MRLDGSVGLSGKVIIGSLSLQMANAASGPSNFRRFATCSEGFHVEIKRGCGLGGPCVVKDDLLEALHRCNERHFLWGEGSAVKTRGSFDLNFLFGIGRLGSCHRIFDGRLLEESKAMDASF